MFECSSPPRKDKFLTKTLSNWTFHSAHVYSSGHSNKSGPTWTEWFFKIWLRLMWEQLMRPKTNFSGYSCLRMRLNVLFRAGLCVRLEVDGHIICFPVGVGGSSICITHPGEYPHNQRNSVCVCVCGRSWLEPNLMISILCSENKSFKKQKGGIVVTGAELIFLLTALIFFWSEECNNMGRALVIIWENSRVLVRI